jgi:hypothetical protein
MQRHVLTALFVPVFIAGACLGDPAIVGVGESDEGGGDGGQSDDADDGQTETGTPGDDGSETGVPLDCAEIDAFSATLAATLTPAQYDAAVHDLTGASGPFASPGLDGARVGPFGLGIGTTIAAILAPEVAAAVDLDALLPCDPGTNDEAEQQACFDAFVPAFARMAWRRPVASSDLAEQTAAFEGGGPFDARMRDVIASVLADPRFLEIARTGTPSPDDAALVVLDDHALATRLAMFLWSSGPDEELLDLADAGQLQDPGVLHDQALRLLADPRAGRMVDDFHAQWLGITTLPAAVKDPELFPQYDAELATDMLRATQAFARSVVLDGNATLADLFTLPRSYANDAVAAIYGDDIVGAAPAGPALEPVELDPEHRGGLLGEPSFATQHSHPAWIGCSLRGLLIRRNLLCADVPPPPPDVGELPELEDGTHKETCEMHVENEGCATCHKSIDQLGYALDNYDPIGRWTDTIDGMPVDPDGNSGDFTFEGRADLVEQLLASEEFSSCTVRQYVRYALDVDPGTADQCTLDELGQVLADSGGSVRDLALAIVDSDAFRVARVP